MIPAEVAAEIEVRLARAEAKHGVRVLFAVESGSRAWGFPSPDSDYDVRFVYARPAEWYLSIGGGKRDTIEYPIVDEVDISGWDVRKALGLFAKSNPSLMEWIQSPIHYRDDGVFLPALKGLVGEVYDPRAGMYHYRSMAVTNRGLMGDGEVKLKRYFYVLRPLLCCLFIEELGTVPPIELAALMPLVDDQGVIEAVEELLAAKKVTSELGTGSRIPALDAFFDRNLDRLQALELPSTGQAHHAETLNHLFRATIGFRP